MHLLVNELCEYQNARRNNKKLSILLQSMTTAQTQTLPAFFTFLETCIALNLTPYRVTSDRMVLRSSPNMHYSATPFVCVNAVL